MGVFCRSRVYSGQAKQDLVQQSSILNPFPYSPPAAIFNYCAMAHLCAVTCLHVCHGSLGESNLLVGHLGIGAPHQHCGVPCQSDD